MGQLITGNVWMKEPDYQYIEQMCIVCKKKKYVTLPYSTHTDLGVYIYVPPSYLYIRARTRHTCGTHTLFVVTSLSLAYNCKLCIFFVFHHSYLQLYINIECT